MDTSWDAAGHRPPPTIGAAAALSITAAATIALLIVVAINYTSILYDRAVTTAIRDTQSQAIASEIELALLTYQTLSNLVVITGEPELEDARAEVASRTRGLLSDADEYVGSPDEAELVQQLPRGVTEYVHEREKLEASGTDLAEIVRGSRTALTRVIQDLETLRNLNDEQVRRAHMEAQRVDRLTNGAAAGVAAILIVGLPIFIVGVRRYLVVPLMTLHRAIVRYRSGHSDIRLESGGLREIAEAGEAFNDMANTLTRQRDDQLAFLAGVAHDLRNPLAAIKVGLVVLGQTQSEPRRRRMRVTLDKQVDRLTRMVGDLLDAARIEAGHLEMQLEDVDLRDIVDDMVDLYAPTSPDHQITVEAPPEPVWIFGDPGRMEQVVSNLLSNALKFSPRGGLVEIHIGNENGDATLSVTDHGIGISREDLPNVFLPFRRARSDIAPGAGLGLSVVRRIITAHGGTIAVESVLGVGSTFRIRVPARPADCVSTNEKTA